MAQMNRDYSSDISNLLDLALRYKSAEDEKEYRDAALLAEKEYRSQQNKNKINLAKLNILANEEKNLYDTYQQLMPIALKYGITTQKISGMDGEKSPDIESVLSTAGDNFDSLKSDLETKISALNTGINQISKEIAIRGNIMNQIGGLYSGVYDMYKNQSPQDRYMTTPQEAKEYFKDNPLKVDNINVELTPDLLNMVVGALNEIGREEYGKLESYKPDYGWIEKVVDGKPVKVRTDLNQLVGQEIPIVPEAEKPTDTDKRNAVVADLIREAMIKFDTDPGGTMSYIRSNIIGTNQNLSYLKGSGKNKDAQNAFKKAMTYFVNRYGTQSINPIQPTEQTATPVEIDFSKYEEP